MKIASLISGLLIVALIIMFFTGAIDFENSINESIITGNRSYAANNYEQALETYKKGLGQNSEEPRLNYNSGQASYHLNKYEDAVNYYIKTSDTPDKYLNSGNSSLKLADRAADAGQKQQYYQQALETYKKGIIAFPENIPLKYNYEYVKSKLDDQKDNNENKDNQQQNQENQDKNNQSKQDENSQQNNQNENSQQNEQNKDSQQDNQNGNSQQKDNNEQNQEKSQNQQSSQAEKSNGQDNAQTGEQNKEKNGQKDASQTEKSDSSNSKQTDSNVTQVLKMLEKQEEDSLKNNQEIKSNTKGDEYDW
ncbi:tetratricopeptide repeat protein [Acetivibrio cellulolyticus]|uniref:tetratricopeptide repeat protein n=1 Tax=Acetivibrio cellulolyticus TaxID=35830 RepID=UPI0001E2F5B6|nr:tetratricopeptide repeat protein [Acetivibrio cellulolyticus]